jgi:hypothetical protein
MTLVIFVGTFGLRAPLDIEIVRAEDGTDLVASAAATRHVRGHAPQDGDPMRIIPTFVAMAALIVIQSGCAVMTQRHLPDEWSAGQPVDCEVRSSWILDAVGAAAMLATSVVGVYTVTRTGNLSNAELVSGSVAGAVGGLGAIGFSASAYAGARWNQQCEGAKDQPPAVPTATHAP